MFKATIDKFQTLKGKDTVSILMTANKSYIPFIGFLEGKEVTVGEGFTSDPQKAGKLLDAFGLIRAIIEDAAAEYETTKEEA